MVSGRFCAHHVFSSLVACSLVSVAPRAFDLDRSLAVFWHNRIVALSSACAPRPWPDTGHWAFSGTISSFAPRFAPLACHGRWLHEVAACRFAPRFAPLACHGRWLHEVAACRLFAPCAVDLSRSMAACGHRQRLLQPPLALRPAPLTCHGRWLHGGAQRLYILHTITCLRTAPMTCHGRRLHGATLLAE
jgi:hypothetical protein